MGWPRQRAAYGGESGEQRAGLAQVLTSDTRWFVLIRERRATHTIDKFRMHLNGDAKESNSFSSVENREEWHIFKKLIGTRICNKMQAITQHITLWEKNHKQQMMKPMMNCVSC